MPFNIRRPKSRPNTSTSQNTSTLSPANVLQRKDASVTLNSRERVTQKSATRGRSHKRPGDVPSPGSKENASESETEVEVSPPASKKQKSGNEKNFPNDRSSRSRSFSTTSAASSRSSVSTGRRRIDTSVDLESVSTASPGRLVIDTSPSNSNSTVGGSSRLRIVTSPSESGSIMSQSRPRKIVSPVAPSEAGSSVSQRRPQTFRIVASESESDSSDEADEEPEVATSVDITNDDDPFKNVRKSIEKTMKGMNMGGATLHTDGSKSQSQFSQGSKSQSQFSQGDDEPHPRPNRALEYYHKKMRGNFVERCSGTITKVRLFNFMCHESFEKDWNPNLNFIIGENGSGKSAILSGIIVGLGGRAATTARTKSIKGLVKHGKEYAKIEVTLSNNGLSPIEKYGKELIIQRVIDLKGVSTYKINDGTTNKFRALRRIELDCLLASFGIMIDNPVAILNQETARSFLKTKDPRDKYNFFFEGSSLGKFSRILAESKQNMRDSRNNLKRSHELVTERKDEVTENKKLKAKLDEADKMEDVIKGLDIQYHWSLVVAEEKKRDKINQELEIESKNLDSLKGLLAKLTKAREDLKSKAGARPEDIQALKIELRDAGKLEMDAQREAANLRRKGNELTGKARAAEANIKHLKNTITKLEEKIEELSRNGEAETDRAKKEQEEQMAVYQEQKDNYQQQVRTLMNDKEQFQRGTDTLRTQLNDLNSKEKELSQQIEILKKHVLNIARNLSENKYDAYGPQMKALMGKIQANLHRFKVEPKGPIGVCFTVKDPKWIRLIELILNNQILNFIVQNQQDQNLLNQLIKETFHNRSSNAHQPTRLPSVIFHRSAFERPFDVSRTKATTPEHNTILDMITVSKNDFAVLNVLIDASSVESILLFDSNKVACDLLKDRNNPNFPHKCLVGYTLDFYQVTPDPRYRLEARNNRIQNIYLKCNPEAQLRNLKANIEEKEAELEELKPELGAKRKEEAEFRRELYKKEDTVKAAQRKLNEVKANMLTLTSTPINAPDISSFVDELNDTKEQLETGAKQLQQVKDEIAELKPKITYWNQKKEELTTKIADLRKEIEQMQDIIDNLESNLARVDDSIRNSRPKVRESESKCETTKQRINELQNVVQEKLEEAEKHGPRVDTTREPSAIAQEIKGIRRRVEEAKKLVGNREDILRQLKNAEDKYMRIKMEYECWSTIYKVLKAYVKVNVNHYKMMIGVIGNVLTGCFQILISSRGYKGRLIIDHITKELFYFVCPDGQADEKTDTALKSNDNKIIKNCLAEYTSGLSGGERSFATICYIISMWQIMECPFFMLDEFDVFMDPFNRKASQNALLSHAQRYMGHQFFLFTPLELADMEGLKDATIMKMFPPEREEGGPEAGAGDSDEAEDDDEPSPGKRRKAQGSRQKRR